MDARPAEYWDGSYLHKNPSWHVEDSPYKARNIAAMLARNRVTPRSVVEIGCGAGEILVQLQKLWPEAEFDGYEISPQAMELARTRGSDRLRFHLADFLESGVSGVDVSLAIDVVEHMEDYYGFLRRLRERAEFKVFQVPLEIAAVKLIKARTFLQGRDAFGHIQYFTKDSFLATLRDTGYEVMDWMYTTGVMDLPQPSRTERILNIGRRALYPVSPDAVARLFGSLSLMVVAQ